MFWNLVAAKYERYHLHHLAKLFVLIIYSFLGAGMFMICEAENEKMTKNEENMRVLRTSIAAKHVFVQKLQVRGPGVPELQKPSSPRVQGARIRESPEL